MTGISILTDIGRSKIPKTFSIPFTAIRIKPNSKNFVVEFINKEDEVIASMNYGYILETDTLTVGGIEASIPIQVVL